MHDAIQRIAWFFYLLFLPPFVFVTAGLGIGMTFALEWNRSRHSLLSKWIASSAVFLVVVWLIVVAIGASGEMP